MLAGYLSRGTYTQDGVTAQFLTFSCPKCKDNHCIFVRLGDKTTRIGTNNVWAYEFIDFDTIVLTPSVNMEQYCGFHSEGVWEVQIKYDT